MTAPRAREAGPDAVTFDLWYTLAYLAPRDRARYVRARRAAWTRPLRSAGVPAVSAQAGLAMLERAAARWERSGRAPTLEEQARWLARRTGVPLDPASIAEEVGRAAVAARARLGPGALEGLRELRAAGVRLGLVSNILGEPPEATRAQLERLGLAGRFAAVVLSAEVGAAKPSPRPFRLALAELGVAPSRALHVGDLASDVVGAWRAGMSAARFVGLARFRPRPLAPTPLPRAAVPRVGSVGEVARRLGEIHRRGAARPQARA